MLEIKNGIVSRKRELFSIPDLTLDTGHFVALIGANGTGKSSLLNGILGDDSLSGDLVINKIESDDLSAKQRSKLIAFVDNKFLGKDYLTTQEFLSLGRYPYTGFSGRLSEKDSKIVVQYAKELNIDHLLDQSTDSLSDGERQRAGIARALIQETPIILLDEPTSFLDYPTKKSVLKQLREITLTHDKLILMATHDLELSCVYCSDWLVVDHAKKDLIHLKNKSTIDELISLAFPE